MNFKSNLKIQTKEKKYLFLFVKEFLLQKTIFKNFGFIFTKTDF